MIRINVQTLRATRPAATDTGYRDVASDALPHIVVDDRSWLEEMEALTYVPTSLPRRHRRRSVAFA
jgi:hypothetical protein